MLFRYTEIEESASKTLKGAVSVSKCSVFRVCLYPIISLLFVAGGILMLLIQPIRQYAVSALILFIVSFIPIVYFVDALVTRMLIGNGRIAIRKLSSKEAIYTYTDVSWRFQSPKAKRSAILVYVKNKTTLRILPGARNYTALLSLRHKGGLSNDEKELLRKLSESSDK